MTAMINLNSYLAEISNRYGFEIYLGERSDESREAPTIRFRIETSLDTFHLKLSRSWKSTKIEFIPGAFASQIVTFLCKEILTHKAEIENLLLAPGNSISDQVLEIDGKSFNSISNLDENQHILSFYLETMTSESSIEHLLLNEKEAKLIELAVSIFATLLPRPSNAYSNPEEVTGFPEGATTQVLVNKYERDPRNRAAAISAHGYACLACGFDFKKTYGDLGTDFIIVHHVVPVSQLGPDYLIDPARDLVSLCANCHAMIHREDPPLSLDQLKEIIGTL
jgi:5-methylcytosine-specific restriction protein A